MTLLTAKQAITCFAHLGATKDKLPKRGSTLTLIPKDKKFKTMFIVLSKDKSSSKESLYECTIANAS